MVFEPATSCVRGGDASTAQLHKDTGNKENT